MKKPRNSNQIAIKTKPNNTRQLSATLFMPVLITLLSNNLRSQEQHRPNISSHRTHEKPIATNTTGNTGPISQDPSLPRCSDSPPRRAAFGGQL